MTSFVNAYLLQLSSQILFTFGFIILCIYKALWVYHNCPINYNSHMNSLLHFVAADVFFGGETYVQFSKHNIHISWLNINENCFRVYFWKFRYKCKVLGELIGGYAGYMEVLDTAMFIKFVSFVFLIVHENLWYDFLVKGMKLWFLK